jgi:hypothetical protein
VTPVRGRAPPPAPPPHGSSIRCLTPPKDLAVTSFGPNNIPISGTPVALVAGGTTVTAGGNSPARAMPDQDTLRLTLDVTAATGTTPSITVTLQHSHDGTTWTNHSAFAAKTTAASERKVFAGIDNYVRLTWTVSGTTPSFTFGVTGTAV